MPATQRYSAVEPDFGPASGFLIREDNSSGRVICDPLLFEPPWDKTVGFARARLARYSEHTAHQLILTYQDQVVSTALAGVVSDEERLPMSVLKQMPQEVASVHIHQYGINGDV